MIRYVENTINKIGYSKDFNFRLIIKVETGVAVAAIPTSILLKAFQGLDTVLSDYVIFFKQPREIGIIFSLQIRKLCSSFSSSMKLKK